MLLISRLRYALYGSLASVSLISLSVSAGTADGVFGDYFRNIISTPCAAGFIITGFSETPDINYGKRICRPLGEVF
jgi:hypothetical protein